ncbi:MAG TPA: alpha/beta fold hydrolase [Bryobacteraceae bacterium]|nr:alpha/beta fold hydrolase [Bryobacteraceae bacterium]
MKILILTHGAGSNRNAPLLVALANAFAGCEVEVVRYDLPFRQQRPHGPPRPGDAERDREGLREQVLKAREKKPERVWLGGQSYGGRQASLLASEIPDLVEALLLLSYPLHAPGKPQQLRTAHFPKLTMPALFVHGSKDPFGSLAEMKSALPLIPGRTRLLEVEGAGHDLGRKPGDLAPRIVEAFTQL